MKCIWKNLYKHIVHWLMAEQIINNHLLPAFVFAEYQDQK